MDISPRPSQSFTPKPSLGIKKKWKKWLLYLSPVVIIAVIASVAIFAKKPATSTENAGDSQDQRVAQTTSLYSGLEVGDNLAKRRAVAAMIENSPDARPQSGLINADIVYEAVTEGGITRFMGIFATDQPTKIGPVRSARSYFIDWLSDYDAIYAHAGGSPTALARISQYSIKDYPQSNDAYHREPQAGLASEHTLYADVAKIFQGAIKKYKASEAVDFGPWKFTSQAVPTYNQAPAASPIPGATATAAVSPAYSKININFSSPAFQVIWSYDASKNNYSRAMAGSAHKDKVSGEQISASTIVTMTVQRSANAPYSGTGKESEWSMQTIGSGVATVYRDGQSYKGSWKKSNRTERLRFYDEANNEIELRAGKIWIEVVPQTGSSSTL